MDLRPAEPRPERSRVAALLVGHGEGLARAAVAVVAFGAASLALAASTAEAGALVLLAAGGLAWFLVVLARWLRGRREQLLEWVDGDARLAPLSSLALDAGRSVALEALAAGAAAVRLVATFVAVGTLPAFVTGTIMVVVYVLMTAAGSGGAPARDVLLTTLEIWLLLGIPAGLSVWALSLAGRVQRSLDVKVARLHRGEGAVRVRAGTTVGGGVVERVAGRLDAWVDRTLLRPTPIVVPTYVQYVEAAEEPAPACSRCQVCGQDVEGAHVRCARCSAPHHADCWEYGGGCSIYGCGSKASVASPSREGEADA